MTADIGAREVTFSWEVLPPLDRNGLIISYTLTCSVSAPADLDLDIEGGNFAQAGLNSLDGFRPNTSYVCTVFAINGADQGPSSEVTFNTSDESK